MGFDPAKRRGGGGGADIAAGGGGGGAVGPNGERGPGAAASGATPGNGGTGATPAGANGAGWGTTNGSCCGGRNGGQQAAGLRLSPWRRRLCGPGVGATAAKAADGLIVITLHAMMLAAGLGRSRALVGQFFNIVSIPLHRSSPLLYVAETQAKGRLSSPPRPHRSRPYIGQSWTWPAGSRINRWIAVRPVAS
jgi:hypothetical protein